MEASDFLALVSFQKKVKNFIDLVSGSESLYGLCPYTLHSVVISLLPSVDHTYQCQEMGDFSVIDDSQDVKFYVIQKMLQALRECTGLLIPKVCTYCLPNLYIYTNKYLVILHDMEPPAKGSVLALMWQLGS